MNMSIGEVFSLGQQRGAGDISEQQEIGIITESIPKEQSLQ